MNADAFAANLINIFWGHFGQFAGHWVYFMTIWYIVPRMVYPRLIDTSRKICLKRQKVFKSSFLASIVFPPTLWGFDITTHPLTSGWPDWAKSKYWGDFFLREMLSIDFGKKGIGVHFGTFWYILLHFVTFCYILLHFVTFCYILLHFVTFWYVLVHSGTFWYILVHSGTFWYILVHSGTFWYILVHSGTFWYILRDFSQTRLVTLAPISASRHYYVNHAAGAIYIKFFI
jgi:hypothetical protein